MDRGNTKWWSPIMGTVILILIIGGCIGTMAVTANALCIHALTEKLPIYPDAEVSWEGHNLASRFGIGETYMILESDDDRDTVHDWYNRYQANRLRYRRDEVLLRFGRSQWNIEAQEDGTGSNIILHGVCVQ